MKKQAFQFLLVFLPVMAFADPSISGITVKQRWPWSDKIDVDFTLSATTNCDAKFSFAYHGTAVGVAITNKFSDATVYGVAPGEGHFVLDPADFGLSGRPLGNFSVTAEEVVPVSERTFVVVNLSDGSYEYMATRPADELGWTNDVYKSEKMVFRRVPAGTYTVGHTDDELRVVKSNPTSAEKSSMQQRQVSISSDYYIAIYPVTHWQRACAGWTGGYNNNRSCTTMSFDELRGVTNAEVSANVNWPVTGLGEFGQNTFLGKIRQITGGKLMIDLPTETQWEVAMRAGTTTIFPNGGTSSSTKDELKELWLEYSPAKSSENVGLRKPNQWDIYNPVGMVFNWCLDAQPRTGSGSDEDNTSAGQSGIDPYGQTIQSGGSMVRIARGTGWADGSSIGSYPGFRRAYIASASGVAFRLAIHLADPRIRR